jgi:endoglucanase
MNYGHSPQPYRLIGRTLLLFFFICSISMLVTGCRAVPQVASVQTAAGDPYNYAELLQKSIYFYKAQRSGPLPAGNRVSWRGDSALLDGADNSVDLSGGWYDAGDHMKFGLPMAAASTMLSWSLVEYREAYLQSGQLTYMLDTIKWSTDYFIKAHTAPNELWGQVGQGNLDHNWWGPAEVMPMARPSYKIDAGCPGSDLAGETAAALAAASIVFRDHGNQAYAGTLLTHATQLYDFADTYRGAYTDCITEAANYYNSWSGYWDELVWGALWLYRATDDITYLDKAQAYYPQIAGATGWTHNWDNKSYGSYVLLVQLTGKAQYRQAAEAWLNYWTLNDGSGITYTPGGLAWLDQWGALRYTANTAFIALVYADWLAESGGEATLINRYHDFAVNQIAYILGDNPRGCSYVVGFGNCPPQNPHHRTSHGSWADDINIPITQRHTLYGALVGGPDSNDNYTDLRTDYVQNEVAIDYNAGFTGAVARLYLEFGGEPLADFPPSVTLEDEFFVEAHIKSQGARHVEISGVVHNRSSQPAQPSERLSYRYFVNLSEVFAAGYTLDDITITTSYSQGSGISDLIVWDEDNDVYYVAVYFYGINIYPGGQSAHRREAQFRLALPDDLDEPVWDSTNDWSYTGLTETAVKTVYIPVYDDGLKIFGEEPANGELPAVEALLYLPLIVLD